jgi:hypothetical protein
MLGGPVDTADIEPTSTDRAGLDGEDRAALVRMIEEQRLHLKSTREDFNHMRNKYEADLYQREDALLDARKACKTMREERDLHAAEKRKLAVDLNTMTAVHDARFTMITNTQALLAARRDSSDTDKIVTQIDELKKERTQAANQISYKENALNTARQTIGAQSVTIDKLRVRLGQEVGQNMAVSPVVRAHPFRAYYKQMVTTMSRVDANGHRLITETCSDVPPPNTRVKWSGDNSVIEDTTFAIGDRVKLRSTGAVGTVCSVATASNEFKVRVRFDESVEDAPDQLHVNVNLLEKHVDDAKPVLAPSAPAQECVTTTTPVPAQDLIVRPTYKIGDRVTVLFGAHIGSTRTIVGGNFYDSPYSYKWKLSGDLLLSSADFEHAKEIKIGSFVKLLDDWNMPCGSVLRVDEIVSIGKYRLTYANDNARRFGELQRNGNQIVVVDAPKELS